MCWNGQASAAIAVVGLSSAYLLKKRGAPKEIYVPTAYFVLMEGLQAATYTVVGECGNAANVFMTHLAVIHISLQPIFINMLGMQFVDKDVREKVKKWVYLACIVAAAFCLARLLPLYDTLGRCELGTALCSHTQTCAYRGEWHIGWNVLLNGFNERWIWYLVAAFLIPILYGSWKWSVYHYFVGPFLAGLTTVDPNEQPAVWCLFSTCIIALLVNTRLREKVQVKKWFTWKYLRERPAPIPQE